MSAQNDVRVTVRVDKDLKEQAESLFERLGMNMSTALNVFLRKAVDVKAIPFPISASNAVFGQGYTPDDITALFETAVNEQIAQHQKNGVPVAKYDSTRKQAYLESADGKREYVNA